MTERELNTLLLEAFPELEEDFEEYTSWQDGIDTGCFLTYEDVLLARAIKSFEGHDSAFEKRVGDFIEGLITSGDEYAENLAYVALLEGLKAFVNNEDVRPILGPVSLKEFDELAY